MTEARQAGTAKDRPRAAETVDGLCGICPAGCWIRAEKRDGRLESVRPLPDHPMGAICTIGRHSPQIVHDPDRLLHPMLRRGEKGTYDFERISWDDAYGLLVDRLQAIKRESGPEAAAIYTGRGSFDMAMCDLYQPAGVSVSSASSVLFPFGSPNTLGVGALCYVSFAMIAPHTTMGETYITMDTDIEQAELIVVWGANPATDSPPLAHRQIVEAAARGAEVVVVDPRRTGTAIESGAEWIPIRPGTDGALALGLIQVMLEEEIHDEEFARDWTVGFEDLASMVQHYRPEVVQEITGIPAERIRRLARSLAGARGACPVMYTGLEYSDSGVQAIRAVFVLWALAGQLDVPGGLQFRMKENVFPQNRSGLIPNPDPGRALGRDRFPVYTLYRGESHAIALPRSVLDGDPYRIRALIALGGSMITAWPDPALWRRTLAALDFLVCIDRYPTADSAYADLVLPACTQYEVTSYMRYGPMFKIREPVVEPQGDARNDFLILAELARRLGYGDLYPQSEEAMLRHALEGSGFTLEQVRNAGGSVRVPTVMMEYRKWEKGRLRPDGRPGFDTPSGKFEIASSILQEHGYEPLPVYTEPGEGPLSRPDLARDYPLVFNSGSRTRYDFRSQHHGVQGLSDSLPAPLVFLNEEDAAGRGIGDGDRVRLETVRGGAEFVARVSDRIVRGAVDANQGGGGPLGPPEWRNCNVNELTDLERYDPISGFPVYKALLCRITRVGDGAAGVTGAADEARDEDIPGPSNVVSPVETREVYLDHAATTPVDPRVLQAMLPFLERECGNPSSIHRRGAAARSPVEAARRKVAQLIGCTARRVLFVSCGTEANNMVLQGVAARAPGGRGHIITSAVEHPAVLATCRHLEIRGFDLTVLGVDHRGRVDPGALEAAIRPDTVLASVMLASNETGALQPVKELAAVARSRSVPFHTDAVQAPGRVPVDVEALGVDYLSLSAHKVHGPKGIGALYVRKGAELEPLIHGGDQERGMRAGTENVAGIVGFGKACELAQKRLLAGEMERVAALRDRLEREILRLLPGAEIVGDPEDRLPVTSAVTLPGIRGESLVLFLDRHGIAFSSGSACKSGHPDPSHALLALGMDAERAHCTVRFSLGVGNTAEDVDYVLERLRETVETARNTVRFVSCR